MPILKDNRKEIKINLPSDKTAEVVIKDGLLAGDIEEIEKGDTQSNQSFLMLSKLIVSWNFTDENGKVLPITIDNIKKMNINDINYIVENINFVKEAIKKNMKNK